MNLRKPFFLTHSRFKFTLLGVVAILVLLSGCSSSSDPNPVADPVADNPVDGDPPASDPPADNPPASDPPADNPPATDPPADDPPASDPPADNPPASDPPADNPPATDPPADDPPADPPADNPPAADPPADDPPAGDPPADDPPADDPPADDPPADDPPADDPPADDPPADDPPADDPPADDPPADDPPAGDPPADPPVVTPTTGTVRFINLGSKPESRMNYAAVKIGTSPIESAGIVEPGETADLVTSDCDQELIIAAFGDDFRSFLNDSEEPRTERLNCGEVITISVDTDSVPPIGFVAVFNTGEIPGSIIHNVFIKSSSDSDFGQNVLSKTLDIDEAERMIVSPTCGDEPSDVRATAADGTVLSDQQVTIKCASDTTINVDPDDGYHPRTEATVRFINAGNAELTFVGLNLASAPEPADTSFVETKLEPGMSFDFKTDFFCNTRILLTAEDDDRRSFFSEPEERVLACGDIIEVSVDTGDPSKSGTFIVVNNGTPTQTVTHVISDVDIIFDEGGTGSLGSFSGNLIEGNPIQPGTTRTIVTEICDQEIGYRFMYTGNQPDGLVTGGLNIPCDGELTVQTVAGIQPPPVPGSSITVAGALYLRNISGAEGNYIASVFADSETNDDGMIDLLRSETVAAGSAAVIPMSSCDTSHSLVLEGAGEAASVLAVDVQVACGSPTPVDITFDKALLKSATQPMDLSDAR